MDAFSQSCSSALEYPHNIVPSRHYPHVLDLYAKLLRTLGPRLFCEEDKARVELWQSHEDSQFHHETVQTHSQLKSHLCTPFPSECRHPQSRFFIIQTHRNSSREKLNVTNEMMTHILSYHQVMPQFTEVLASFGKDAAQDFQFCGFKSELWTALSDRALAVPELNRSGRTLELCYSLRAVEPSNSYKGWPWSVKQLGISHSFDVEKGQSAWIVLKADGLMKDRIMSATRPTALPDMRSFGDRSQSFTSSLSTHLLFCEWAVEHWRWYINFMETQIQEITGARVFVPVIVQPGKKPVQELLPAVHQTRARTLTFGRIRRSNTWASISRSLGLSQNSQNVRTGQAQGLNNDRSCGAANATLDGKEDEDSSFSYDDLQRIQVIEEKVNEAILVLTTNNQILNQLRGLYSDLDKREGWPLDLSQKCSVALSRFENRVGHLQCELDLLQKRTETLMALLSSRKTLVHGILEWRSMEASKIMAVQSQASTDHMLSMTDEMRELAVKTKQETVSMRIITLVTLFFLPGTFISTLMSTDIVRFDRSIKIFSPPALNLFLAISLPLMFFTFVAWYLVYWWVDNTKKKEKSKEKSSSQV